MRPPKDCAPTGQGVEARGKAEDQTQAKSTTSATDRAALPQFTDRRRFLIWALMAGYVKPERLTERIVAELEEETP